MTHPDLRALTPIKRTGTAIAARVAARTFAARVPAGGLGGDRASQVKKIKGYAKAAEEAVSNLAMALDSLDAEDWESADRSKTEAAFGHVNDSETDLNKALKILHGLR